MFNNRKKEIINGPSPPEGLASSLLSSNLTVTGNLESDGDIQVEGTIHGNIQSFSITVSDSGVVRGTIDAEKVTISGTITGKIRARHIILIKGANVTADLIQDRLSVEPGVFFEGNCSQYLEDNDEEFIQLEYNKQNLSKKIGDTFNPEKMTKKHLIDYASSIGLELSMKLKKDEIMKAIKIYSL